MEHFMAISDTEKYTKNLEIGGRVIYVVTWSLISENKIYIHIFTQTQITKVF